MCSVFCTLFSNEKVQNEKKLKKSKKKSKKVLAFFKHHGIIVNVLVPWSSG